MKGHQLLAEAGEIHFRFLVNVLFFSVVLFQIPVIFNALGGILVGLVTSRAGGVRKASFRLVFLTPQIVLEHYRQEYEPHQPGFILTTSLLYFISSSLK